MTGRHFLFTWSFFPPERERGAHLCGGLVGLLTAEMTAVRISDRAVDRQQQNLTLVCETSSEILNSHFLLSCWTVLSSFQVLVEAADRRLSETWRVKDELRPRGSAASTSVGFR